MINKIHQRRRGVHCFLVSPPLGRLFCLAFALFLFVLVLKSTPLSLSVQGAPGFKRQTWFLCSMVIKKYYIDIDNLKIH